MNSFPITRKSSGSVGALAGKMRLQWPRTRVDFRRKMQCAKRRTGQLAQNNPRHAKASRAKFAQTTRELINLMWAIDSNPLQDQPPALRLSAAPNTPSPKTIISPPAGSGTPLTGLPKLISGLKSRLAPT